MLMYLPLRAVCVVDQRGAVRGRLLMSANHIIVTLKIYVMLKRTLIIIVMAIFSLGTAFAQQKDLVVRIARLVIDSAQLDAYKSALKEHAQTAIRVEPGVLNL